MKTLYKVATLTLLMFVMIAQSPGVTPQNLLAGVAGPLSTSSNWANFSAVNLISGASLFPATSTTTSTVLYIGFTAGTRADIGNMVLYTTKRARTKITAVTPVKFKGVSNPSISLTDTAVCPVQPVSAANPCIVRLDTIALTLSVLNDYYFVPFFINDANNGSLGAATPALQTSSFLGTFVGGDQTHLRVGQSVPSVNQRPFFLMFVMNN